MKKHVSGAIALLVSACAGAPAAKLADVIYMNGNVWTGVEGGRRAEAVAIGDDRLLYVGDDDGAAKFRADATEIVDLGGKFVAPGFIDNHTHFLLGGFGLASVDLRGAATREEFVRRIGDYAKTREPGEWILNGGWDHELWGGEMPTRDWIDPLTGSTPVFVVRTDGHMMLANSAALTLAGIDENTPTPAGGEIIRDAKGRPTGILKDAAMALVERVIPPPTGQQQEEAFQSAQASAFEHGVTQVHDMALPTGDMAAFHAYQRIHRAGAMKIRVYVFAPLASWQEVKTFVDEHGRGDEVLRWGAVKGFVDGSLGSRTAWFFEPYDDHAETTGLTLAEPETIKAMIRDADAAGLHVAVHAIGDRANDFLLTAFEEVGGDRLRDKRFRVEHAQHLTAGEIEKFGKSGIIASMQPYHAIDDGRWAIKRIGPERIKKTYAFRSLLDAGAVLTFGSDWPVAPMEPLAGIDAAMFRRTTDGANPDGWVPEEKITAEEALRAYTVGNAYAGFEENRLGTLQAGKLADVVVLSGDPTQADENTIGNIRVVRTVVGGETVFLRTD